ALFGLDGLRVKMPLKSKAPSWLELVLHQSLVSSPPHLITCLPLTQVKSAPGPYPTSVSSPVPPVPMDVVSVPSIVVDGNIFATGFASPSFCGQPLPVATLWYAPCSRAIETRNSPTKRGLMVQTSVISDWYSLISQPSL